MEYVNRNYCTSDGLRKYRLASSLIICALQCTWLMFWTLCGRFIVAFPLMLIPVTIAVSNNRPVLQSEDIFGTMCAGCPEPCDECNFDTFAPKCVTLSAAGIAHASSPGGETTIEGIVIEEGYWRATNTSTSVLECYNRDACPRGVTTGKCNPGYEGPCEYLVVSTAIYCISSSSGRSTASLFVHG